MIVDQTTDVLTGERVRLWPYVPGVYGRDALYRVWRLIEDHQAALRCFWDQAILPTTGGDLASFVKTFDGTPGRFLLMVESIRSNQLCGCLWFTEIQPGHQAFISIFMAKAARGKATEEASALAIRYAMESYQLRQLWAVTPWPDAAHLCERMGFWREAILPDFAWVRGERYPVMVFRLTREV